MGWASPARILTDDGVPEVYLTNIGSNRLESLVGGPDEPTYENIAHARGVSVTTPSIGRPVYPSTSWHPEFDDVNNDGRMDLFVSKGNVDAIPDNASEDPNELLLGQPDGTFRRATEEAGILDTLRTRGAALADLNADGLLDLVEVHRDENVSVRRNVGNGDADLAVPLGHWLAVKLEQTGPNRDAVGAWIDVESDGQRTVREITVGGGHASGELGPVHFGLGKRTAARVRVLWPDGIQGPWHEVEADQSITIDRRPRKQPRDRPARDETLSEAPPRVTMARLAHVELPEFGMPRRMPTVAAATYASRLQRARERASERGLDLLLVYADREHSANLAYLDRLRPPLRGGRPHRRRGG